MAAANMMKIYVTHIDESIEGCQGPYLYFWGIACDSLDILIHRRSLMKTYIKSLTPQLEKSPPLNLNMISSNQICCVLIKQQWHRAIICELKLSKNSTIEVLCIDSGVTYSATLTSIRTLDMLLPGSEVEHLKNWPALSKKFILADVCAPCPLGSLKRQWSAAAMRFLKRHVENHTWKASAMDFHGECEILRLFYPSNKMLAFILLKKELCDATKHCIDALATHEVVMCSSLLFPSVACKRFLTQTENEDNDDQNLPKKLKTMSPMNPSQEDPSVSSVLSNEVSYIRTGLNCMKISEDLVVQKQRRQKPKQYEDSTEMSADTEEVPSVQNTVSLPLPTQMAARVHRTRASKCKVVPKILDSAQISIDLQNATSQLSLKNPLRKRIIKEIRERRIESDQSLETIPKRSKDFNRAYARRQSKRASLMMASQNLEFSSQIISTRAVVPYAKSPVEFWIHLEPDAAFILLERINQHQMDSVVREKFRAFVSKPCLAPFADGKWYRARIVATNEDSTTVHYLDYGNNAIVSTSDLRKLPMDFIEPPALAFKCRVDGVEHFANDIAEAFRNLVVDLNSITVHCLKVVDGVLHVRLFSSDVDLVERLCVDHMLEGVGVEELPSYLPLMLRTNGNYPTKNRFQVDEIPLMNLNSPLFQLISSVSVVRYIEPAKEVCNQFGRDRLMEEIALSDVLRFAELKPRDGIYCLCLFREDERLYRAVVKIVEHDQVSITFVDYGISSKVNRSDLRVLPRHLTKQPGIALRCTTEGIELNPISTLLANDDRSVLYDWAIIFTSQTSAQLYVQLLNSSCTLNVKLGLPVRNLLDPPCAFEVEMASPAHNICLESEELEKDLIEQFTVKMDILVIDDRLSDPDENTSMELVTMDF